LIFSKKAALSALPFLFFTKRLEMKMIGRNYPANAAPKGRCESSLANVPGVKGTQEMIVARRRKVSAELPGDIRAYLRDVAYAAHEAATTNDPEVARLTLAVLARQAETLEVLARSCQ
jgi:hypothetical protein